MKIAVFCPLGLGGMLCAVPALRALHAAYPGSRTTLIGLPRARALALRLRRYLDAFLEFPGFPGMPGRIAHVGALPDFFEAARGARFDLLLQMHGSGEFANPLAVLMGARRTAGFCRPGRFCPDPQRYLEWRDGEPEVERWLRLLEHLGVPAQGTQLEFPLQEPDLREADGFGLRHYAVLHPETRFGADPWPAERFAQLGDALCAEGLRVVLTAGTPGSVLTRGIKEAMREPALDLAGRTTLGGFAALIARARLAATCHPAVTVLAGATRTPAVLVAPGAKLQDTLREIVRALACAA